MDGARDVSDATGSDQAEGSSTELPRRGPRSGPGQIARAREDFYGPQDANPAIPAPRRPAPSAEAGATPSPGDGEDGEDAAIPSPETSPVTDGTPDPVWPTRAVRDRASTEDPGADTHRSPAPRAVDDPARPASRRTALLVAVGALLLALGLVLGYLVASLTGDRAGASVAAPLPSRPTMLGQVLAVPDGQTVSVRVGDQVFDVSVLGLDAPTSDECGAAAATALASTTLTGQFVTLVPDPTIPEFDERGRRLSYVVLRSQRNYTDVALTAGAARADTARPLWYSRFFTDEEATARAEQRGIWGLPCETGR